MNFILASLMIGSAAAMCAESCNGHGKCEGFDKCNCYDNWTGPACKSRVCPYTKSWAGVTAHGYAECGNKGECDRGSGLCKCFDGYTGKGCDRLMCAGDGQCGGHGTCERFGDVNTDYTGWDQDKIMVCKCDPGYTGPGCEARMCKPGDDIMTPGGDPHVSKIVIDGSGDGALPTGEFYLSFRDWRGQWWDTWALQPIGLDGESKPISVEEALEALPNHAIPDVNVSHIVETYKHTWEVTFVSPHNTGNLDGNLQIHAGGCNTPGCQPFYTGITGGDSAVITWIAGGTEADVCSNRGTCDSEAGICQCVDGFYGEACEKQTIII